MPRKRCIPLQNDARPENAGLLPSYATYTTAPFRVPSGSHTITFQGLDTAGGDNTAFIDDVHVNFPDEHVTTTAYNASGWADTVGDPRGVAAKTLYDMLGRTTESNAAYDSSVNSGNPTSSANQTTTYTYDGSSHVLTQTAVMPSGSNSQVTQYTYGVSTSGGSFLDSNDLLAKVQYPSASTGSAGTAAGDIQHYSYNLEGQVQGQTSQYGLDDQNGTYHQ